MQVDHYVLAVVQSAAGIVTKPLQVVGYYDGECELQSDPKLAKTYIYANMWQACRELDETFDLPPNTRFWPIKL